MLGLAREDARQLLPDHVGGVNAMLRRADCHHYTAPASSVSITTNMVRAREQATYISFVNSSLENRSTSQTITALESNPLKR
jgi:hypothetical protein